jgi:hypothetical protein
LDVLLFVEATIYQMDEENEALCEQLAQQQDAAAAAGAAAVTDSQAAGGQDGDGDAQQPPQQQQHTFQGGHCCELPAAQRDIAAWATAAMHSKSDVSTCCAHCAIASLCVCLSADFVSQAGRGSATTSCTAAATAAGAS